MKKIFLISGIFLAHSLSSQANQIQALNDESSQVRSNIFSQDSQSNAPVDKFQQLLEFIRAGQPTNFADAEGVYTGRCYDMKSRNVAIGSALVVMKTSTQEQDGPLFSTENVVLEGGYKDEPASDIDSRAKETLVQDLMANKLAYSNLIESPLSVVAAKSTYTVHKYDKYLLLLVTSNSTQSIRVRNTGTDLNLKKGDAWIACYYFNKK